MKTHIIIPARSGSKGIPEKPLTYFGSSSLLQICIDKAVQVVPRENITVTTNDEEISVIAQLNGINVIQRPASLSDDHVTLDPVIYHACKELRIDPDDAVITLQVTSPNLSVETLNQAINRFKSDIEIDTLIGATEQKHLAWHNIDGQLRPKYTSRVNRQELPVEYVETGAFFITKNKYITSKSRIGQTVSIYVIPEIEADDIDDRFDYSTAIRKSDNHRIAIITDGNKKIGTGHVFNSLELARRLPNFDVKFFIPDTSELANNIIQSRHYSKYFGSELYEEVKLFNPRAIILDKLNTSIEEIRKLDKITKNVISFEDLGPGSHYTRQTYNALYPQTFGKGSIKTGYEYFIAKAEFLEKKIVNFEPERDILVMFGGTDPSHFTESIIDLIGSNDNLKSRKITILLGVGKSLDETYLNKASKLKNVNLASSVKSIRMLLDNHKIAVTSGGRTMLELALLKIPFCVLLQNDREELHFIDMRDNTLVKGFKKVNCDFVDNLTLLLTDQKYFDDTKKSLDSLMIGSRIDEILTAIRAL